MSGQASEHPSFPIRELAPRIISALVLATITLGLTWAGPAYFAFLVAIVSSILLWEWSRLTGGSGTSAATLAGGLAILLALATLVGGWPGWSLAVLAAGAIAAAVVATGPSRLMAGAGVVYAGLPSLALVWLRSDATYGLAVIVFLFLVVWATDTGAFIAGRAIGGPRLWARVSPNKTWAGLVGGVSLAAVVGGAYTAWVTGGVPLRVIALAAALGIVSQGGDLFESGLKRAYGVKDASGLIPGHGGFMDRVDGLVFAAVAAAAYALVVASDAPAHVLLGLR